MDTISLVMPSGKNITGLSAHSRSLAAALEKNIRIRKIFTKSYVPNFLSVSSKAVLGIDLEKVFSSNPVYIPLPKTKPVHFTSQQQIMCLNYLRRNAIVTIHDIIPLVLSHFNSVLAKKLYLFTLKAIKNAAYLTAVSQNTKNDVVNFLKYPEDKIKVVYNGINHAIFKTAPVKRDECTLLYAGSEMPHKNVRALLKAFVIVKQKIPEAKLVKVGLPQWNGARKKLLRFVKQNNLQDSVIFKDYVENLAGEYQKATLFVFPSKYEGFGFPPLEAMACGCPVVCSNATSLPEVVGSAALTFDPDNVFELSEKIIKMLDDEHIRKKYSSRGIVWSQQFTWDRCASETIEVYKKVWNI